MLAVIAREAERSRFAVDTKPSGLFTLIGGHLEAVVSVVVAGDLKLEIRDKVPCRAAGRACLCAHVEGPALLTLALRWQGALLMYVWINTAFLPPQLVLPKMQIDKARSSRRLRWPRGLTRPRAAQACKDKKHAHIDREFEVTLAIAALRVTRCVQLTIMSEPVNYCLKPTDEAGAAVSSKACADARVGALTAPPACLASSASDAPSSACSVGPTRRACGTACSRPRPPPADSRRLLDLERETRLQAAQIAQLKRQLEQRG